MAFPRRFLLSSPESFYFQWVPAGPFFSTSCRIEDNDYEVNLVSNGCRKSKDDFERKRLCLNAEIRCIGSRSKYKDFEWTTEFPLERLCISELGLKAFRKDGELVRTGYRDIASVPFPGVPARVVDELAMRRSNEEHEKAYKTKKQSLPTCPLLIPSTPTL